MQQNQKTVKEYYVSKPKFERLLHLDLNSPCIKPEYSGAGRNKKYTGDLSQRSQKRRAQKMLKEYLELQGDFDNYIHLCHLCEHNSMNTEFVCQNPLHCYVGSASENAKDVVNQCPHCGKEMIGRIYYRWHGDNCKFNPNNSK